MKRHPLSMPRRQLLTSAVSMPLVLLASGHRTAHGSMVLAMELPELTAAADAIVVAQVVSAVSRLEDGRRAIRTEVELRVQETWKGLPNGPASTIKIVQPGGVVGDLEMRVHGLPTFPVTEQSVLFLNARNPRHEDLGFRLTGLGQGKRRLFKDAKGELMAAASDRSAAVQKAISGGFQAAPQDVPMRLFDLRQQVRLLLKGQHQ